jgi:hypothetical protein
MAEPTAATSKPQASEVAPRKLTWQEKMKAGQPLNKMDDVKAEADYAVRRHLREQKERAAFEARKNRPLAQSNTEEGGN